MRLRDCALVALVTTMIVSSGCRRETPGAQPDSVSAATSPRPAPSTPLPADTVAWVARPGDAIGEGCTYTGRWDLCTLIERMDNAGLAPRVDSGTVDESGLTRRGTLVHLGNADVELYIYPDSAARRADQAHLAPRDYIAPDAEPTMRAEPTLIANANALAVLHSINDHQRERVADALTGGPPQRVP